MNCNKNKNEELHSLVDNLKFKVKRLETYCKTNMKNKSQYKNGDITTYKISYPKINNKNSKKFVGLLFDNNFSDSDETDNCSEDDKNKISFIKLKNNNIINYSITLNVDNSNLKDKDKDNDNICTFSLGILDPVKLKLYKVVRFNMILLKIL